MEKPKRTYTTAFEASRTLAALMRPEGLKWLTELPRNPEAAPIVLHISCNAHYTLFIPFIAQEVLRLLGKRFVVLGGPENCCGSIQFNMGDHDLEAENATKALLAINRLKPQLLVSVCPDCDEVFEKFRVPTTRFAISNISELFMRFIDELRPILKPVKRRVVLHYHAINPSREADATRIERLLREIPGLEIIHAEHNLGPGIHCQTVKPMHPSDQESMFAEAARLGADALVVPYHSCYRQHCKMQLRYPVEVQHYLGIVAESLGIPFAEPFKALRLMNDVEAVMAQLRPGIEKEAFKEADVRTYVERAIFC